MLEWILIVHNVRGEWVMCSVEHCNVCCWTLQCVLLNTAMYLLIPINLWNIWLAEHPLPSQAILYVFIFFITKLLFCDSMHCFFAAFALVPAVVHSCPPQLPVFQCCPVLLSVSHCHFSIQIWMVFISVTFSCASYISYSTC
jgi:hypothetical protein